MFCGNCGKEIIGGGSSFCVHCGKQTNHPNTPHGNGEKEEAKTTGFGEYIRWSLKVLTTLSVLVFFLPLYEGEGVYMLMNRLNPSIPSVIIFATSLVMCMMSWSGMVNESLQYKVTAGLGLINLFGAHLLAFASLLSKTLMTQRECIGSRVVFALQLALSAASLLGVFTNVGTGSFRISNESVKEIFKKTYRYRTIIKLAFLTAIISFILPCAVTGCSVQDGQDGTAITGLSLMESDHIYGVGRMYVVTIFVLFVLGILMAFIQKRGLVPFLCYFGATNGILLVMTKLVFYNNIVRYLIGSFLMFACTVVIAVTGFFYQKKMQALVTDAQEFVYYEEEPEGVAAQRKNISVVLATVLIVLALVGGVVGYYYISDKMRARVEYEKTLPYNRDYDY